MVHSSAQSCAATISTELPTESATCLFCQRAATTVVARGRDYEYDTCPDYFDLVQCQGCSLMFIQPRPAAAAMEVIYPSNYYAYNEEAGENRFVKFFRDRVELVKVRRYRQLVAKDDATIVDIGCGDGRLLEILRRFGPSPWSFAGVELGDGAAQRAAAKGFEVRHGDFESLDIHGWQERFDLALMHHVIEHTREPRATVRKVARLLRRGGIFSVETPEIRGWDFSLFRARYWGGYHIPRHFFLFNVETLSRLLREEGFEIVSARSILSPAFWIFSLHNWLVDKPAYKGLAKYFHPQNIPVVAAATAIDLVQMLTTRQSTNLQVLARKI